jgi:hypothetical protein
MFLDTVTASLFRSLSRLRGARVFHPRGAAYEAVWRPAAGSSSDLWAPGVEGDGRAIVRISRGVGLRPPVPDVLGVAIKVLDAHGSGRDQDLMLASVGAGRWASRVLRPARSFSGTTFSSVLPYDVAGTRTPVVGVVHGEPVTSVRDADERPDVRIEVSLARTGAALARVILTRPLSARVARDLRFDPGNTGGAVRPAGFLNRLRRPVYEASQDGRSAPPDGTRPHLGPP